MTTPKYQKIPGTELTSSQMFAVMAEIGPKYGSPPQRWYYQHTYYFDSRGKRFLSVWS